MRAILSILTVLFFGQFVYSQNVSGIVTDGKTKEPVYLANVIIKGTTKGVTTDFDGKFEMTIAEGDFPITLQASFVGYKNAEIEVAKAINGIELVLQPNNELLEEVSIIEQRLSEKQRESALTVEALDNLAIKETPAVNFYEALGNLKGVDLTSASIGFKIINTRGFNSTSPVRSLQLIDGVDNQAPGLNFSLGNFLGASELDILNVDIIAGASTAFYGPGAFNGVISMTTKDPFIHQGVSASVKVGERALTETAVRYAEAFKLFNEERENFAIKLNLFYLTANDWVADNYDPVDGSPVGADNPGRYDAVNIYGDESLASNNDQSSFEDVFANETPGLGIFYRPGYREEDIVDYDTRNFKGNVSLAYKTKKEVQYTYTLNYGTGTTVYQGENRFSLNDIQFMQNIFEVKKKDKFFLRAYNTTEDAGNSYDAVLTAFKMNDISLGYNEQSWNTAYTTAWKRLNFSDALQETAGFDLYASYFDSAFYANEYQVLLEEYRDLLTEYHDSLLDIVSLNRILAGTEAYDNLLDSITSLTFQEGGSKFYDRSQLYHVMGEYEFDLGKTKFRIGGNYRLYLPNSRGNIFDELEITSYYDSATSEIVRDTSLREIRNQEFGTYIGAEQTFFGEMLKASATLRMDKNQNFDYLFSPAASLVYNAHSNHTFRASVGRAIRNPTLQDQYLRYDVGRATLLGNISGYDSLVTIESFDYFRNQDVLIQDNLEYFNVDPVRPEQVTTVEFGYRGSWFKRLFVDMNYFYSWYTDFIGYQFGLETYFVGGSFIGLDAYRIAANATDIVTTQGFNLGLNYYVDDHITATGNYSFNQLNQRNEVNPIVPAFNTPEHKYNLGINGRAYKIFKKKDHKQGFAVTYKWVEGFVFEGSPQFTGFIPSYDMVDAQFSYQIPAYHVTMKLGASNILNNQVYQVYGGPRVGRLAYFSLLFEWQ